jgi:putative DNA primase/helicase
VGGVLCISDFGDNRPEGATDFNDLARLYGIEAVKRLLLSAPDKDKQTTPTRPE